MLGRKSRYSSRVVGTVFSAKALLCGVAVAAAVDAPSPSSSVLQQAVAQEQPDASNIPVLPPTIVAPDAPAPEAEPATDAESAEPALGTFTSPAVDGYNATSSTTGLKIDAPLIDVPGSIQVISPDLMEDQATRTLDDVVRNVPGLVLQTNGGNRQEIYILRGFNILQSQFRKDGLRDVSRSAREIAHVERVEILRGPASVLYGSGSPAGTINLITKSPLDYAYTSAQYTGGSYGFNRATIDTTGPIDEDGEFLYRLNVAGQLSDSFRDFVFADRAFVAPAFTWVLDECSRLTVKMEYLYDDRMMDRGIVAVNGGFGTVPISNFFGEPTDVNRFREGQTSVFFDRQLTDIWSFRAGWVSDYAEEVRKNSDSRTLVGTTLRRAYVVQDPTVEQVHMFTGDLAGTLDIGPWQHKVLFGTELGYFDFSNVSGSAGGTVAVPYGIDIYNPVYGQPAPGVTLSKSYNKTEVYALYAQDLIELNERWKVLISGRCEDSRRYTRNATSQQHFDDTALTGRYGVVYQPVPERLSLYATYGESFTPLNGQTFDNQPFVPETGELWETGVKIDFTEDVSFTVSGFDVFRQNATVADPVNPGFSVQTGEVESKGVEALLAGYLTDNWTVVANCAYVDARITEDTNPQNIDLRLVSTPYFTSSIWTRYDLFQSQERTFGVALGYLHVGNREGNATRAGAFELPEYERWDLAFYYDLARWEFALNIENLLDEEYYVGSQNATNVTPGAPITALGTIRYRY